MLASTTTYFFVCPTKIHKYNFCCKVEFVLSMLHLMGKVHMRDVKLAAETFDRLDLNSDGTMKYTYSRSYIVNLQCDIHVHMSICMCYV